MESWYPVVTIGIGFGAAVAAITVIKALFNSLRAHPHVILNGVVVDEQRSPELHAFVEDVAEKVQGRKPDNVVVGLEPTFYAVSAPVDVISADRKLKGETLYMSVPLMRLFNTEELRSVIGHELGHFSGKDTEYSKKFAPIYGSLQQSYLGLMRSERIAAIPVTLTLGNLFSSFDGKVKKISRERELVADQAGAIAGSASSLITALLKVSLYADAWEHVTDRIVGRMKAGMGFTKNISWLFASVVQHNVNTESILSRFEGIKNAKICHPTDSHPPTVERASQLNIDISSIRKELLLAPQVSSLEDFPQHKELEEELSEFEQAVYHARGAQGEMEGQQVAQRIVSMFAALMTLADGEVDKSEVEMAESIGAACFDDFDYFQYREYCHYPELLLEEERLLEITMSFNSDFKQLIFNLCRDIARADGEIAHSEQELLDRISVSLEVVRDEKADGE